MCFHFIQVYRWCLFSKMLTVGVKVQFVLIPQVHLLFTIFSYLLRIQKCKVTAFIYPAPICVQFSESDLRSETVNGNRKETKWNNWLTGVHPALSQRDWECWPPPKVLPFWQGVVWAIGFVLLLAILMKYSAVWPPVFWREGLSRGEQGC